MAKRSARKRGKTKAKKAVKKKARGLLTTHPHKSPVATRCYGKVIRFESIAEAARAMGIEYSHTISNCCRGLVKTAGGLEWWYTGKKRPPPIEKGRAGIGDGDGDDDRAVNVTETKTKAKRRRRMMSVSASAPLHKISLNGDMFNDMKSKFDALLTNTLQSMQTKESEEATITLKLSITLKHGDAPCDEDAEAVREVIKPLFEHKIVSAIQYKDERSGTVGGGEYEMYWDTEAGCYVTRRIGSPQTDLFDAETEDAAPEEPPTVRETEAEVLEIEDQSQGRREPLEIEDRREVEAEEADDVEPEAEE